MQEQKLNLNKAKAYKHFHGLESQTEIIREGF